MVGALTEAASATIYHSNQMTSRSLPPRFVSAVYRIVHALCSLKRVRDTIRLHQPSRTVLHLLINDSDFWVLSLYRKLAYMQEILTNQGIIFVSCGASLHHHPTRPNLVKPIRYRSLPCQSSALPDLPYQICHIRVVNRDCQKTGPVAGRITPSKKREEEQAATSPSTEGSAIRTDSSRLAYFLCFWSISDCECQIGCPCFPCSIVVHLLSSGRVPSDNFPPSTPSPSSRLHQT